MSYNGTGTFSRLYSWASDKANSIKILASRFDQEMDGIATGLSNVITRDGQTTTTQRVPFAVGVSLAGASTQSASGTMAWSGTNTHASGSTETYASGSALTVASGTTVNATLASGSALTLASGSTSTHASGSTTTFASGATVNMTSTVGTLARNTAARFSDHISVADFTGADPTGVAESTTAISAMATAVGFVRFSRGVWRVTTSTLDVPVFFEPGAYLSVDAANTYTITNTITSPRQWIFRGSGLVVLSSDGNTGEDARQAHVSWFGAFPSATLGADQAPFIQKAITAFGNLRESELLFDIGNYHIGSAMTVTRGCHILGSGTRRTVFRLYADGFDVFTTSAVACKFSHFQFEVESPITERLTGAYIKISHGECEVYDVQFYTGAQGVFCTGNNCRVDNVVGTFGSNAGAGSSLVHIASGSNSRVSNVSAGTSAFGPEALVRIGGSAGGTVSGVIVDAVNHTNPSASIWVEAFAGNVSRCSISNVIYNGSAGTPPTYAIKIASSSTFGVSDVMLSDIVITSFCPNGILFSQDSSGTMEDISLDNVDVSGSTGIGINFTRTLGTLRDIKVGDTCDMSERATPFSYTGTSSDIRISPMATPGAAPAYCYTSTIADDAVLTITLNKSVFTGVGIVTVGTGNYGMYLVRAAATPAVTAMTTVSANLNATTGALTGTTGVDGKVTVSADVGMIYIENRLGSSQAIHFTLLTGN